ncbi:hypothetical protein [Vibrio parahaemolyticus]|uniref:Tail tubular protein B n=1 Tax=Vibrio parahaemolyticus TaxID=670 RepID=A0AA47L920_VIBPH|nr:hypothetical protein [Vibrio parahaemolyticus]MEA5332964.1 hypothetical protein [Vibrio parahaemolyticus]MEA5348551.1 hypothetical protein [Vibrio parahaemolyticus]WAT93134.1 hypothetical protein O1Q84_19225 [Vibrio parahaemolyticus]
MLVSQSIPDMIGGVSQQAPLMRFPNQAEEQINCKNSPVTGVSKRPNTKHVADIVGSFLDYARMKTHIIDRDETERYLIGILDGEIRAWDLMTGVQYDVEGGQNVNYLRAGSVPARQAYKAMTLGDDTFILNTTMPVTMDYTKREGVPETEAKTKHMRIAFSGIDLSKPVASNPYASGRNTYNSFSVLSATYSGVIYVSGKTLPYNMPVNDNSPRIILEMLKKNGINAWLNGSHVYFEVDVNDDVSLTDNSQATVEYSYKQSYWESGDRKWVTKTLKWTEVETLTGLTQMMASIQTAPLTPSSPQGFVWIRQADYSVNYDITINGTKCSITTPEATSDQARAGLNSSKMTDDLIAQINEATSTHGCVATRIGNTIHIRAADNQEFDLEVSDGLYGEALKMAKGTVEDQTDLPPDGVEDHVIHVAGKADSENDGYYVKWVDKTSMWTESTAYGLANEFNHASMPHMLRRYQDTSRVSTKNPYGIYFKLEQGEWSKRTVGDELSAPIPSFVSTQDESGAMTQERYISAMAFFRGRLWFLGGDYACGSVVGDKFNFFRSTALTVLDDDPIDGYTDLTGQAETIHAAIPSSDGLVVFTERGQYLISSQGMMSPTTFEFTRIASYATDNRCDPVLIGDRISFATKTSEYTSVSEMYVADTTGVRKANEVTSHCPTYIEGSVHRLLANATSNTEFLIMRGQGETLTGRMFIYDFLMNGNERVQSAWSQWTFNGAVVVDGVLTSSELYLVMVRATSDTDKRMTVERIDLVQDPVKVKHGHPVFLDSLQECEEEPQDLREGEVAKRVKFSGGHVWYRGYPYVMRHTFSQFFLRRDERSAGDTGGRLQLRRLHLNFHETTSFYVEVETEGRELRVVHFQGRVLGHLTNIIGQVPITSGERSFPLLGESKSIAVSIFNDSIYDSCFQSAFWEGFYHNRARRF